MMGLLCLYVRGSTCGSTLIRSSRELCHSYLSYEIRCIKLQPFLGISCTFQFPNIVLLRGAADDNEVHDFTYIGTQFTSLCEHIFNVFTYRKPKLGYSDDNHVVL